MNKNSRDQTTITSNESVFDEDRYLKLYDKFRMYCNHEDSLVNSRNSWFIGLNSFLFTSIALSYFVFGEKYYSSPSIFVFLYSTLLSLVGLMSSFATYMSVHSAFRAIYAVNDMWIEHYEKPFESELSKLGIKLPGMMGGAFPVTARSPKQDQSRAKHGVWISYGLTSAVGICWFAIGFFGVLGYRDQCIHHATIDHGEHIVSLLCLHE